MSRHPLVCVGECMLELSERPDGTAVRAFGGDTLNTAIYAARSGADVRYVTALGDDPFSADMIHAWRDEGIDCHAVRRIPGRVPGLYWIATDALGERSFYYWRDAAPYRDLFRGRDATAALADLRQAKWLYLTGISLAVLDVESRLAVFEAMREVVEAGGQVAFDINYRPQLWEDLAEAASTLQIALAWSTIALPGLDDMRTVFGSATPAAALRQLQSFGVQEAAVKDGARGVHLSDGTVLAAEPVAAVVDTTAAGDAFNGAYLAARLAGEPAEAAAMAGQRLAARVIQAPGAIIPRA
ncbi:MAG: sugar kinase [Alphaproteobacteria bacterium]|nr:sugar kinase [Alphaproteobacteria bacterium]MCB9928963.1 sugar kinase [Alphaproteobacteria bacterium]